MSIDSLTNPKVLYDRNAVLSKLCPIPPESGVYAWYFRDIPNNVPLDKCITKDSLTLLYLIAKENIQLACEVSEWLGGTNQYIHQLDSIEQSVRNRQIMTRSNQFVSHHRIAKELGLSSGWVKKIIRERRPSLSPEKKELLNNLFKLAKRKN